MTTSQPEHIACPLCGTAQQREPFFVLRNVPVTCTSIFDTAAMARAVPSGSVELSVCASCGFVFSGTFDPALGELGARYESSQAASLHFSAFMQSLAGEWTDRYRLSGKTVLEVGCGSGHFLRALLERGVGSAIGMDPFAETAGEGATNPNLQLIADRFDARSLHRHADALVCRHTLEHIQDVSGFLQLLRRWAGDNSQRVLLFEVPDAERVLTERAFWDVYYEHCNYFTASTLRFAFESAGFEVLRLQRVYGDQYLILEAVASTHGARPAASSHAVSQAHASCRSFGEDVRSGMISFST